MRQHLLTIYLEAAQAVERPTALEAVLVIARRDLTEEEYSTLLGRLLSQSIRDQTGETHQGERYRVRVDYQALLQGSAAMTRSWQTETVAINAAAALAYALIGFHQEISNQGPLLKIWGVKAQIELVDEALRQSLEGLLPGDKE